MGLVAATATACMSVFVGSKLGSLSITKDAMEGFSTMAPTTKPAACLHGAEDEERS